MRQFYTICYRVAAALQNKEQVPMSHGDIRRQKTVAENVFDERMDVKWSNIKRYP
jgi:hypothetical protein